MERPRTVVVEIAGHTIRAVPKRTNLFQEVVEIIHKHIAGDAAVEPSAILRNRATGAEREVDVVIRANTSGYEVIVSIEAVARSRKADREWVDQMLGKHRDLPTSKLVLVSERGFTAGAREDAIANGALPLAPEDLASDDPTRRVVNALPSLWPKTVAFTPEQLKVWVDQPGKGVRWFLGPSDLQIFLDDGAELGQLLPVVHALYDANWPRMMDQIGLAHIEHDMDPFFHLQVGPPWTATKNQQTHRVCLRGDEEPHRGQLHPIEKIEVTGKAAIRVSEVPLSHHRLGEVMYAYGEGKVGDQDALLVATEDAEGGRITFRLRDGDSLSGPVRKPH